MILHLNNKLHILILYINLYTIKLQWNEEMHIKYKYNYIIINYNNKK